MLKPKPYKGIYIKKNNNKLTWNIKNVSIIYFVEAHVSHSFKITFNTLYIEYVYVCVCVK